MEGWETDRELAIQFAIVLLFIIGFLAYSFIKEHISRKNVTKRQETDKIGDSATEEKAPEPENPKR